MGLNIDKISEDKYSHGIVTDISEGGMKIVLHEYPEKDFNVDRLLRPKLRTTALISNVNVSARIANIEESEDNGNIAIGIEFVDLHKYPDTQVNIKTLLDFIDKIPQ